MFAVCLAMCLIFGGLSLFIFYLLGNRLNPSKWFGILCLCVAICIGMGFCAAGIVHQYDAKHPDDAVQVYNEFYKSGDTYYYIDKNADLPSAEIIAHGRHSVIFEVEPEKVLSIIMKDDSLSVNDVMWMEKLATECGIELPSSCYNITLEETNKK